MQFSSSSRLQPLPLRPPHLPLKKETPLMGVSPPHPLHGGIEESETSGNFCFKLNFSALKYGGVYSGVYREVDFACGPDDNAPPSLIIEDETRKDIKMKDILQTLQKLKNMFFFSKKKKIHLINLQNGL